MNMTIFMNIKKIGKEDMNKRYYLVEIILYTSNLEHMKLLKELKSKYNYAYIIHDKDTNDDGSLKKEHIHLLLFFNNARWGSSILKEIKIDNPNLIEFKENKASAIQYLIHSNNTDKFQYNMADIESDIDIDIYFNKYKDNETKDISIIYDYIVNYVGILTYSTLYFYCVSNSLWSSYRRNYSIIKDLVLEHNSIFTTIE